MPFNPFGKKDSPEPAPKREFPAAALGLDNPQDSGGAAQGASKPGSERRAGPPASKEPKEREGQIEQLAPLTDQLDRLGQLLDQSKEQVMSYLLHRESQSGTDAGKALAKRFDAMAAKLEQLASSTGRSLDALYGKLEQLSGSIPRGGGAPSADAAAPAPSDTALKTLLRPLAEKLEQVDAKCKTLTGKADGIDELKTSLAPNLKVIRDSSREEHVALNTRICQIWDFLSQYVAPLPQYVNAIQQQVARMDAGVQGIANQLRPPEPAAEPVAGDWQEAILGPELAGNPDVDAQRRQLLAGVLAGEPAACALVGNLLIFRSSSVEKMPTLLKDVGEAYYRWQPRISNKPSEMEKALVAWVQRTCEQAGVSNTIELVHPGERFDSARHNASERGVEITQVLGWIVLRDNGKVYTKASVAVK